MFVFFESCGLLLYSGAQAAHVVIKCFFEIPTGVFAALFVNPLSLSGAFTLSRHWTHITPVVASVAACAARIIALHDRHGFSRRPLGRFQGPIRGCS